MGLEDRALQKLDRVARVINERGFRATLRASVRTRLERLTVEVLDRVVETITDQKTNTRTRDLRPKTPRSSPTPTAGGATPPLRPSDIDGLRRLDERSGIDRLVLLPRSDNEAFAYWETEGTRLRALSGDEHSAELRLFELEEHRCVSRTEVRAEHGRAYLELPARDTAYLAELVVGDMLVSRSRPIRA